MPFALNESTRFISPTKTPEFLAAGCPWSPPPSPMSVRDYGDPGLRRDRTGAEEMAAKAELLLARPREEWLKRVDARIAAGSWDSTWARMTALIKDALAANGAPRASVGAGAATAMSARAAGASHV
jgi:UDP-galactopyranose mutase